jgi:hypothetical protein
MPATGPLRSSLWRRPCALQEQEPRARGIAPRWAQRIPPQYPILNYSLGPWAWGARCSLDLGPPRVRSKYKYKCHQMSSKEHIIQLGGWVVRWVLST